MNVNPKMLHRAVLSFSVLVVLTTGAVIAAGQTSPSGNSVDRRQDGREATDRAGDLSRLRTHEASFMQKAARAPETRSDVAVSFTSPVVAAEIATLIQDKDIQVIALFHQVGESGGGFRLRPHETFTEGVAALEEEYRKMVNGLLEDQESLERTYGDIPGALERYEAELAAVRSAIDTHSIQFYGVQLNGKNSDLLTLRGALSIALILPGSDKTIPDPIRF